MGGSSGDGHLGEARLACQTGNPGHSRRKEAGQLQGGGHMAGVGTGAGDQGGAGGWAPAGAGYNGDGEETRPAPPPRGREGSRGRGRGRGRTGGQWELLLLLGNGVWNTCSTSVML